MNALAVKRRAPIEYAAVGLAYLIAAAFFFRSVLFGAWTLPFDLVDMDFPRFSFVARWIHRLVIPLWDPHIAFGIPLAGQMGTQTFYPPIYLMFLLGGAKPGLRVIEWGTVTHLALGAFGVYVLCRVLRLSRVASFTGGLIFAFGGFFPLRMIHGGWVDTAAWFPFALAAWFRFLATRRLRYVAWMTVALLLMLLAGLWQQVMYSMYFALFWAAWETGAMLLRRERLRTVLLPMAAVMLACGFALAADSCELFPTYRFAKETVRQQLTLEDSASTGIRVSDIPGILWAGTFAGAEGEARWSARRANATIRDYYPGTIALILLLHNLLLVIRRPERNQVFLWLALLVFTAASFGPLTPVFGIFYKFAPGFAFFRRSSALYYFPILAAAVLCAYSLHDLVLRAPALSLRLVQRGAMILAAIALGIAFALRGGIDSRGALLYFAGLSIFGAVIFGVRRVPGRSYLFAAVLSAACFADLYYFNGVQFANLFRNFNYPKLTRDKLLASSPDDPYRVALAPFGSYWDNLGELVGFENPGGYVLFRTKRYEEYFQRIQSPESPLLASANVRYLLTSPHFLEKAIQRPALTAMENRVQIPSGPVAPPLYIPVQDPGPDLSLFRNTQATPRYYFSSAVEVIPDSRLRLDRMSDRAFADSRAAILEQDPGAPTADCAADPVKVLEYTPNRIRLQVAAHAQCLLVAADSYHPDWNLYADGRRIPVLIADGVFRASVIPPGSHLIEMKFEPASLWVGIGVSLAALLTFGVFYTLSHDRIQTFIGAVRTKID